MHEGTLGFCAKFMARQKVLFATDPAYVRVPSLGGLVWRVSVSVSSIGQILVWLRVPSLSVAQIVCMRPRR